jgi:NADH-quinone oxidoreductase subunit J
LLTRRDSREHHDINPPTPKATAERALSGVLVAVAVFGGLMWAILKTQSLSIVPTHIRVLTVKQIGLTLMIGYVWPLQCVGVLLTAALIGALILVMEEKK